MRVSAARAASRAGSATASSFRGRSSRRIRTGPTATPESGQRSDLLAGWSLGHAQIIEALQVQPELRARAEEMTKSQRRITRDRTLTVQYSGHAVRRNRELTCEFRGSHLESSQFLVELLTRVNRKPCHGHSLVVIDDVDVDR
jgi:hypothetical protein